MVIKWQWLRILVGVLFLQTLSASADTLTFSSGSSWQVTDSSGNVLGNAQNVCVNSTSPPTCPNGATIYGFPGSAWTADLSSIPGSTWIWAPGVTGTTSPADLQQFAFSQSIDLNTLPVSGTISIAVDDFAQVLVNGISVGSIGSLTDFATAAAAQTQLTSFDITNDLLPGQNTITVIGENGPAYFGGCSGSCDYAQNPAGVVFGGTITTAPVPEPSTLLLFAAAVSAMTLRAMARFLRARGAACLASACDIHAVGAAPRLVFREVRDLERSQDHSLGFSCINSGRDKPSGKLRRWSIVRAPFENRKECGTHSEISQTKLKTREAEQGWPPRPIND